MSQTNSIKINHRIVTVFIILGYKSEEYQEPEISVQVRKEHFMPFIGWELKDVFAKALPDRYKYLVLKQKENKTNEKGDFWVLYCRK